MGEPIDFERIVSEAMIDATKVAAGQGGVASYRRRVARAVAARLSAAGWFLVRTGEGVVDEELVRLEGARNPSGHVGDGRYAPLYVALPLPAVPSGSDEP